MNKADKSIIVGKASVWPLSTAEEVQLEIVCLSLRLLSCLAVVLVIDVSS